MKKIILFMLIAMVPFLTIAQKRTKKDKKIEKTDESSDAKVNFMILKGIEAPSTIYDQNAADQGDQGDQDLETNDISVERLIKSYVKPMSHFYFSFDYGDPNSKEAEQLRRASSSFRSMAEAVHHASKYGWEFINSTIVVDEMITIHYYYMKR
jgi:hypothetical protein